MGVWCAGGGVSVGMAGQPSTTDQGNHATVLHSVSALGNYGREIGLCPGSREWLSGGE